MSSKKQPAIFLDRDGVINDDLDYVYRIKNFKFIPGVFEACRKFIERGYQIIIITNQAGIARGYYTEDDFEQLNQWMLNKFVYHNVEIKGVYYCPHHPVHGKNQYRVDCDCRKPKPGMILRAAQEHELDLRRSILIGDKASDIKAGKSAGIVTNLLVKTGKPVTKEIDILADGTFNDLLSLTNTFFS